MGNTQVHTRQIQLIHKFSKICGKWHYLKYWSDIESRLGSSEGKFINWLTIDDQAKSVYTDVQRIRLHPLVPNEIPTYGYIYDVKTGQLIEVTEATKLGQAA